MSALRTAYAKGTQAAAAQFKVALGPPTQVDQFMADVENGKDIPPAGMPPMSHAPGQDLTALDGTTPLSTSPPTPPSLGSTIGQPPLTGTPAPPPPPPNMGMLGG